MPLIEKEGFANFSLEICVMSEELSFNSYFLYLEQYDLLHKQFNLSNLRALAPLAHKE